MGEPADRRRLLAVVTAAPLTEDLRAEIFGEVQDYSDQVTADVTNCWTQRRVNSQGFRDAQRIGKFIYDQQLTAPFNSLAPTSRRGAP